MLGPHVVWGRALCALTPRLALYQLKGLAGESLTQVVVFAIGGRMTVVPGLRREMRSFSRGGY